MIILRTTFEHFWIFIRHQIDKIINLTVYTCHFKIIFLGPTRKWRPGKQTSKNSFQQTTPLREQGGAMAKNTRGCR